MNGYLVPALIILSCLCIMAFAAHHWHWPLWAAIPACLVGSIVLFYLACAVGLIFLADWSK